MSIVEALLEEIQRQLDAYPGKHVRLVRIRVGTLRQVIPDTLQFCYQAATRGTSMVGSELVVEAVPAEARCRRCSLTFAVDETWFVCPRCQEAGADLLHGDELDLVGMELTQ